VCACVRVCVCLRVRVYVCIRVQEYTKVLMPRISLCLLVCALENLYIYVYTCIFV